jgi:hypothetical protein
MDSRPVRPDLRKVVGQDQLSLDLPLLTQLPQCRFLNAARFLGRQIKGVGHGVQRTGTEAVQSEAQSHEPPFLIVEHPNSSSLFAAKTSMLRGIP